LDEARSVFSSQCPIEDAKTKLSRPPIANPQEYLHPFVEFLRREADDPRRFLLRALADHRVVILGEVHHRPRYWAFNSSLVRDKAFAERAGVIYMELPGCRPRFLGVNGLVALPSSVCSSASLSCCGSPIEAASAMQSGQWAERWSASINCPFGGSQSPASMPFSSASGMSSNTLTFWASRTGHCATPASSKGSSGWRMRWSMVREAALAQCRGSQHEGRRLLEAPSADPLGRWCGGREGNPPCEPIGHHSPSRCGRWSRFQRTKAASLVSWKRNLNVGDSTWPSQYRVLALP